MCACLEISGVAKVEEWEWKSPRAPTWGGPQIIVFYIKYYVKRRGPLSGQAPGPPNDGKKNLATPLLEI